MCASVPVLLLGVQFHTMRCVFLREVGGGTGWGLAVSDRWREKSRQPSTLCVLVIQAVLVVRR